MQTFTKINDLWKLGFFFLLPIAVQIKWLSRISDVDVVPSKAEMACGRWYRTERMEGEKEDDAMRNDRLRQQKCREGKRSGEGSKGMRHKRIEQPGWLIEINVFMDLSSRQVREFGLLEVHTYLEKRGTNSTKKLLVNFSKKNLTIIFFFFLTLNVLLSDFRSALSSFSFILYPPSISKGFPSLSLLIYHFAQGSSSLLSAVCTALSLSRTLQRGR